MDLSSLYFRRIVCNGVHQHAEAEYSCSAHHALGLRWRASRTTATPEQGTYAKNADAISAQRRCGDCSRLLKQRVMRASLDSPNTTPALGM
eukprot:364818-Chlamydomonas_euryale.AAC.31